MMATSAAGFRRLSLWLGAAGVAALALADLSVISRSPAHELSAMLRGLATPDFFATDQLLRAFGNTLAFALQGVALGLCGGWLLAMLWQHRTVRAFSAIVRAVHELFWGLIFLQLTGLSTLTAVLAIGVPYAGIFAKVFGELLEEADPRPARALPGNPGTASTFFFARVPLVWHQVKTYAAYRLECGLRSSALLGFIGLPTLGFHLETAFRQGHYSAGAALLYLFVMLILSMRWWLRTRLMPLYLGLALILAPPVGHMQDGALWRFLSHDLVPAPLRDGVWDPLRLGLWLKEVMLHQGLPGLWQTLILGMAALLVTALLALALFPLVSRHFSAAPGRALSHTLLVLLRSTPEFLLAFVFLLIMGPSMLPGILALGVHTGAIIAHLLGRFADLIALRPDSTRGAARYAYEILPRLYPNFLAFLLYRWEIIMRETAILGLIGIPTLGFYIDSAFSEFRFDRALCLIGLAVILNLAVDTVSRACRNALRLDTSAC